MKIFFDTNVYVAEALDGRAAADMVRATWKAGWRIHASQFVLDETRRVLMEVFEFPSSLAENTTGHIKRHAQIFDPPPSRHEVPDDPNDGPILRAALASGADYLITNDRHLLVLNPYTGLRIISMAAYHDVLMTEGLLL